MDVAINVRARKNPYTCALSYLFTEPFPYPYKIHQTSRPANSSPLFLATSPVECPPLSESHCLIHIVLASFPVAAIKYPRQELREERFYFAHNSKLQPIIVGKSRQQEPEVHP